MSNQIIFVKDVKATSSEYLSKRVNGFISNVDYINVIDVKILQDQATYTAFILYAIGEPPPPEPPEEVEGE